LSLRRELLDRRVIDVSRGTAPRVNDVLFIESDSRKWTVHGALVGASGLMRRVLPRKMRAQRVLTHEHWPNLERIPTLISGQVDGAPATRLTELGPARMAHVLLEIPVWQAIAVMASLDEAFLASVIRTVPSDRLRRLLAKRDELRH
jgi:hypothetical protein